MFSSVQFSHSVVSDSLWPHESQHAGPPCPSPTPRDYSNSCPSSQWCHPAISSSVIPFSSCPQSLPASGSFPVSQLFTWGGQRIGVSASASVLPVNTQGWSPLGWTGWISLQSKGEFQNPLAVCENFTFLQMTVFHWLVPRNAVECVCPYSIFTCFRMFLLTLYSLQPLWRPYYLIVGRYIFLMEFSLF